MKFNLLTALFIGAAITFVGCSSQQSNTTEATQEVATNPEQAPAFAFADSIVYNFGNVKEGDTVEKVFSFTNVGKSPLIISNITSSCGCTTPEWTKEPIAPNAEGTILVRFNTTGKPGPQSKTVSISSNTEPAMTELRLVGIVESK